MPACWPHLARVIPNFTVGLMDCPKAMEMSRRTQMSRNISAFAVPLLGADLLKGDYLAIVADRI